MKTKSLLFSGCFLALMLAGSAVTAAPHGGGGSGGGGSHFSSMAPRGGGAFMHNGAGRWSGQHWNGHWHGGDWHHHHHDHFEDVVFIGGFPFWDWWYPWGYPYYGYYPPYGYYPYGYYGNGYYGGNDYGYGHGDRSSVVELQRRLAHAGYYHGSIDGIMGPQTRRALRAYQRDRGSRGY
jgi:hypothetical protein